jgi:hypothetical protein
MSLRVVKVVTAAAVAMGVLSAGAEAAGPPPPTSSNGNAVQQVAMGLGTPTAFAFTKGAVFESDAGSQSGSPGPKVMGGVYLLKNGTATRLPGSPPVSFGVVWHKGTLYVSTLGKILAWSGWNGKAFSKHRVIYTAPRRFTGFNGLGFGANGRLYVGVDVGPMGKFDHGPARTPYAYDFLSLKPNGRGLKVVATGIRQPWQMAFPAGSSSPFVSVLGQDTPASVANKAPDFVLRVKPGQDYGFPACNWVKRKACRGFARPFKFFSPHTDVMGMAIAGGRLYMSQFGAVHPARVVSMPLAGGAVKPLLTGFVAPIVGLGINGKWLYVGELTGQVFRVRI